jgi:hypothetical protein
MARLRERPRQMPVGGPDGFCPTAAPAPRFEREETEPDPLDPSVPLDAEAPDAPDAPDADFERSERDREPVDDFRPAPVVAALTVLARGRVRSLADLAASRAGTGAALVEAPALAGAGATPLAGAAPAPLVAAGAAPLVAAAAASSNEFGVVPLVEGPPWAESGTSSWAEAAPAALGEVRVAAFGAEPVPCDRTAADWVASVRGSGVPFELSIAPMVSVGSVKGKRTPVT